MEYVLWTRIQHTCTMYNILLQTWDLQRVMYYGFQAFARDALGKHPGYYINPHDINGSVVETVFGQMRQITQHNLTAANYAWTRSSLLTKWSLSGKRKGMMTTMSNHCT